MVDRERIEEFRARFGLGAEPDSYARLRTRAVQAARDSLNLLHAEARHEVEREFAFRNASRYVQATSWGAGGHAAHGVIEELERAESQEKLVERAQQLFWVFEKLGYYESKTRYSDWEWTGMLFAAKLKEAINLSPGVDLHVHYGSGKAELVPAGVPFLDRTAYHATQWLARYPDVQKEFKQALSILADRRQDQFRQAQDSLRFALEKLLKLLLSNNLRLEDQGKPLKEWFSIHGVHESLRDAAVRIMMLLCKQYQNAAVKHDNDVRSGEAKVWQPFEVEFVIYQYATLFRLLSEVDTVSLAATTDKTPPTA